MIVNGQARSLPPKGEGTGPSYSPGGARHEHNIVFKIHLTHQVCAQCHGYMPRQNSEGYFRFSSISFIRREMSFKRNSMEFRIQN